MVDLQNHIRYVLVNLDNAAHFLGEAIEFEVPDQLEECRKLIVRNFKTINENSPGFIFLIPQNVFI